MFTDSTKRTTPSQPPTYHLQLDLFGLLARLVSHLYGSRKWPNQLVLHLLLWLQAALQTQYSPAFHLSTINTTNQHQQLYNHLTCNSSRSGSFNWIVVSCDNSPHESACSFASSELVSPEYLGQRKKWAKLTNKKGWPRMDDGWWIMDGWMMNDEWWICSITSCIDISHGQKSVINDERFLNQTFNARKMSIWVL